MCGRGLGERRTSRVELESRTLLLRLGETVVPCMVRFNGATYWQLAVGSSRRAFVAAVQDTFSNFPVSSTSSCTHEGQKCLVCFVLETLTQQFSTTANLCPSAFVAHKWCHSERANWPNDAARILDSTKKGHMCANLLRAPCDFLSSTPLKCLRQRSSYYGAESIFIAFTSSIPQDATHSVNMP